MRAEDYKYIAAWGGYLGSHAYYIEAAQVAAARDDAPADALYKQVDGTWFCRSQLPEGRHTLIVALDRRVERMEQGA